MSTLKIIIASKNPVKILATKTGFEKMFSEEKLELEGVSVPSNVSDQPMDDEETLLGATNRAKNAMDQYPSADFWVGIEGGIEIIQNEMAAYAWIVIMDKNKVGRSRTASFFLPQKIKALVMEGKELGAADDMVFGVSNSKQKSGAIGLLTDDIIDREGLYAPSVVMALIPFKQDQYY